jgi:hypothetical protein
VPNGAAATTFALRLSAFLLHLTSPRI